MTQKILSRHLSIEDLVAVATVNLSYSAFQDLDAAAAEAV